jgi:tellurite resistance-related uncharacterized protein
MQRHDSLRLLSHDHHHALVLARSLTRTAGARGLPDDPEARMATVRQRFARELAPHFAVEERDLVPRCEAAETVVAAQARRVLADHQAMRDLLAPADDTDARLATFGRLLERHVRFEERTWFPALEATLGAAVLRDLGPRLSARTPMPELPDGLREYKHTPVFDEGSIPAGLAQSHRLKPATWGQIVVERGRLLYVLEDENDLGFVLSPGIVGSVAPERPHHVTPQGAVRFFVRFLRA